MRPFVLAFAVLAASANPAPAQVDPLRDFRDAELFSRQQAAQQRAVELENRLSTLESRLDTEERLRGLQVQQSRHAPPSMTLPADAAQRSTALGGFASIPDDRLAASNARVREASRNRR
jgi:hypothetical protein